MSAPMHTPWKVLPSPTDRELYAVAGEYLVADGLPIEDARLIAAAPCLLEALRFYASEAFDGYGNRLGAKARAAILKATGEGA